MSRIGTAGLGLVTIGAGIGLYMASYAVGVERDRIETLERSIAADEGAIGRLEAELGVRASLTRLEEINGQVWNLKAPAPKQMVGGPVQLAAYLAPEDEALARRAALTNKAGKPATRLAVAVAETEPERPVPVRIDAPLPRETQEQAAVRVARADPPAVAAPSGAATAAGGEDLFSERFLAEVETAATLERAGFRKVALR